LSVLVRDSSDALARRARNLRTLQPILALEANKRRVDKVDLGPFDLNYLSMALIDAVIVAMGGPGRGATFTELVDALRPSIQAMRADVSESDLTGVVSYLIEGMTNVTARDSFRDRYFSAGDASGKGGWVEFAFKLIEERDVTGLDDYRFVASPEAVNLYFQALGIDLQAEEVAQAAVIRYFIEQGKWQEAGDAAERAAKLSIGLKNELLTLFQTLERNAADVEYAKDLSPVVGRARRHLGERRRVEYDLIRLAEQNADAAAVEDKMHMLRVRDHVRDVLGHHNELDHVLAGANDRFVAEQTRQRFRPSAALRYRDPQAELLRPLLAAPAAGLADWFEANRHFFLPPVRRPIADLPTLAPLLLQDPRGSQETSQVGGADETEEFAVPEYFSAEEVARVDELIGRLSTPFNLTDALAEARAAGFSPNERHLLMLRLMRFFGETDERNWLAEPTGTRMRDPDFYGDELRFTTET
jgi:tetratricopeptide (TPR) repeat protein